MWRYSWTQLSMHTQCPHKWYATYQTKLLPFAPGIELQVGRAVHSTIELALECWDKPITKTPAEMVAHFVVALKEEGVTDIDQAEYWRLNAQNMLLGWYTWASSHNIRVEAIERKVQRVNYTGVLDFIGDIDGQRYIVDWKTSGGKYHQDKTDNDGQLSSYVWLDGEHYDTKVAHGVLVKGTSTFQFLESTRTEGAVNTFLAALQVMDEKVKAYHSLDDAPKSPSRLCGWCGLYGLNLCEGQDDF